MTQDGSELKRMVEEFASCAKCREEIVEIGRLPASEFAFHWKPYARRGPPFKYVFLTWEPPSLTASDARGTGIEEGLVDVPLQFFVRTFLFAHPDDASFLITNMAKCSIKTDDICQRTRDRRWHYCSCYLKRELLIARGCRSQFTLISVGLLPRRFLERRSAILEGVMDPHSIYRITHYSRRCEARFSTFAECQRHDFESFCDRFRPQYQNFIATGDNGNFRCHKTAIGDFQRMFKWRDELRVGLQLAR